MSVPSPASSAPDTTRRAITVARGDGIGPEIMDATLRIMDAAGVELDYHFIEVGEAVYRAGHSSGIMPEAWDTLRQDRVLLKAPITTPQGGGYKSLNVTLRKTLNLFANVRPTKSYMPFVPSLHRGIDLVIVRENEEDLYAGIEYQHSPEVVQGVKLISRPGCERIVRYAFDYARAYGREKITCMTKDNIMKQADGLFHRVFDEIAPEYPEIATDHQIIDIGAARVAAHPEQFDVIVTLNLYGDILSDIASLVAGSVGLAGSSNIGEDMAMFEAIHGSAPDIAGKGIANPSGLLVAAAELLVHVGMPDKAALIHNAWLRTLEDGIHTGDVYQEGVSHERVNTQQFADAVIARLGQQPQTLATVAYKEGGVCIPRAKRAPRPAKALVGVDVFLDWDRASRDPNALGAQLTAATPPAWTLTMISNRGVKVYPDGAPESSCSDQWSCRFMPSAGESTTFEQVLGLLSAIHAAGLEVVKTEHLYTFDGARGYSLGQGE